MTSDTAASAAVRTVKITVTDADLDLGQTQTNETSDFNNVPYTQLSGGSVGDTFLVKVKKFPILDNTGDGVVNFQDAVVSSASLSVFSVNSANGLVILRKDLTVASSTPFDLTYKAAVINTTKPSASQLVSVTGADAGFEIELRETGVSTGKFEGCFIVDETIPFSSSAPSGVDTCTGTTPLLKVVNGTNIIATYNDQDPAASFQSISFVENNKPTMTNITPASGATTNVLTQKLSFDVTDADSGINPANLTSADFVLVSTDGSLPAVGAITKTAATVSLVSTGVFRLQTLLQGISGSVQGTLTWRVVATDKAGNTGQSDSDLGIVGNQDHTLVIDNITPPPTPTATPVPPAVPGVTGWSLIAMAVTFGAILLWRLRHTIGRGKRDLSSG